MKDNTFANREAVTHRGRKVRGRVWGSGGGQRKEKRNEWRLVRRLAWGMPRARSFCLISPGGSGCAGISESLVLSPPGPAVRG